MRAEEFDRILDNDTDAFKVPPLPVARATTDGILLQQLERERMFCLFASNYTKAACMLREASALVAKAVYEELYYSIYGRIGLL